MDFWARHVECVIRKSKTDSSVVAVMPVGSSAEILQAPDEYWADGYQHAQVKYNGKVGWVQLDLSNRDSKKGAYEVKMSKTNAATEDIDRIVFGMHHLTITQAGQKITGGNTFSHPGYELDLAGEDSGIDFWYNKMKNTYMYCAGTWGTSGTYFFYPVDKNNVVKKVLCADGVARVITIAMTHTNAKFTVGKKYGYNEVCYMEGTAGFATGNHIHLEVCEGICKKKVGTGKYVNGAEVYTLPNELDPRKVFFILDGFTTVKSSAGMTFKHCSDTSAKIGAPEKTGTFHAKTTSCNLRRSPRDGTIIGSMPKGAKATIMDTCQDYWVDGYQHVQVNYNGKIGWVQCDLRGAYTIII